MDLKAYREIIAFAIANEMEAQRFYADAAAKLSDPHLKEMFAQFAQEELRHRELLQRIAASETIARYFDAETDFKVAETVDKPKLSTAMKPADAIALAMKNEEEAMQQYTRLAEACQDAGQKKVFMDLAAMERGHKRKLETAFVDIGYPEVW